MIEEWRSLLYPLGYIAQTLFMGRFMVQWVQSEIQRKCVVTRSFWIISFVANILLFLHSFIQLQYHICVVQGFNSVISWRNLNLMGPEENRAKYSTVWMWFGISLVLTTLGFLLQGTLSDHLEWMRAPAEINYTPPPIWHFIGTIGIILFSGRFWVQWWHSEKHKISTLNRGFWWISIIGAAISLVYFVSIKDYVNLIGPGLGLIPYIRNLILLQKQEVKT